MSRRALVVQHDADGPPGAVARELRRRGIETTDIRTFTGDAVPASIGDAAALVVLGGAMSADDIDEAEVRLIESALGEGVPVLGVCLGSQVLARALGGRVVRDAATEIGWFPVETTAGSAGDPLFDALPSRFVPFHWHSDAVVLPPGATLLALSELTPVQAFRAGPASSGVYGLQFHLECDDGMIAEMVAGADDELRAHRVSPDALRAQTAARVAEQERLARVVFGGWADAVLRSSPARSSGM